MTMTSDDVLNASQPASKVLPGAQSAPERKPDHFLGSGCSLDGQSHLQCGAGFGRCGVTQGGLTKRDPATSAFVGKGPQKSPSAQSPGAVLLKKTILTQLSGT